MEFNIRGLASLEARPPIGDSHVAQDGPCVVVQHRLTVTASDPDPSIGASGSLGTRRSLNVEEYGAFDIRVEEQCLAATGLSRGLKHLGEKLLTLYDDLHPMAC